ncbi:aminotransferase class V-fold PLP-dependent enzyme [Azospirillum brasilense]|nr:aminotransferase class V-fold PLP-dependent enzyme [Azospirillum brasilense]
MTEQPIYLDSFSTTRLAPEALRAMEAVWSEPGNAGSPHGAGRRALVALERGRSQVAELIGCLPGELIFTSGATEANNLAIRGIADWARRGGSARRRIVVSAIEHKAVLEAAGRLVGEGFEVLHAPVDHEGVVQLDQFEAMLDEQTLLVSVMLVNNETGVRQPVQEAAGLARSRGALVHCDAAQGVGKIPVDVLDLAVDYLSISAHKLYGPMGVGALYVGADAPKPAAQNLGGGQERGMRSGTEPVPLVAGFGAAAEVALRCLEADRRQAAKLAETFLQALADAGIPFRLVSAAAPKVSGGFALAFQNVEADDLVNRVAAALCISTGSACASGQVLSSHVLSAMGMNQKESSSVVRFYFSRYNSVDDALRSAAIIASAIRAQQSALDGAASPSYLMQHETCAYRP